MTNSFTIALTALDRNKIDGAAVAAIKKCQAVDELLEALQELLKFPSGQYSTGNGFDAACLKAEAAIAKATS